MLSAYLGNDRRCKCSGEAPNKTGSFEQQRGGTLKLRPRRRRGPPGLQPGGPLPALHFSMSTEASPQRLLGALRRRCRGQLEGTTVAMP